MFSLFEHLTPFISALRQLFLSHFEHSTLLLSVSFLMQLKFFKLKFPPSFFVSGFERYPNKQTAEGSSKC